MGPRSDNRGYGRDRCWDGWSNGASMGPRSDNRGYVRIRVGTGKRKGSASMGPRSDNRGYAFIPWPSILFVSRLQWVHGRITVVMQHHLDGDWQLRRASMGPRSDNRGYAGQQTAEPPLAVQASMGPRSDNRGYGRQLQVNHLDDDVASMGPRSDNRGYAYHCHNPTVCRKRFNGSTVG